MTPHWENFVHFRSYQQLPQLGLGPSKGFLTDTLPFKGSTLFLELKRYSEIDAKITNTNLDCVFVKKTFLLGSAWRYREIDAKITDANLDCLFVKKHFTWILDWEKPTE